MTILEMDKAVLGKRGFYGNCSQLSLNVFISLITVEMIKQAHKTAKLEDKSKEGHIPCNNWIQLPGDHSPKHEREARTLGLFRRQSGGFKNAGRVDVEDIGMSVLYLRPQV
jgi:hypothetical protein